MRKCPVEDRLGVTVDSDRFHAVLHGFFAHRGLTTPTQIQAWLAEQQLDKGGLAQLIQREMRAGVTETLYQHEMLSQLADVLRAGGSYGPLADRARAKQAWLAENGLEEAGLAATSLSEAALLHWYFVERRGEAIPADLDAYSRRLDLDNRLVFLQVLVREYLYAQEEQHRVQETPAPRG